MSPRKATSPQAQANRRNAQRSTGPRTEAGKKWASKNATKHGAYSSAILLLNEEPEELERFRDLMIQAMKPVGPLEAFLAERIVLQGWRLERARRVERETLEHNLALARYEASDIFEGVTQAGRYSLLKPKAEEETPSQVAFHWQDGAKVERLLRHEGQLERAFFRLLHEMDRIQSRRQEGNLLAQFQADIQP